jgi:hypothetical protein
MKYLFNPFVHFAILVPFLLLVSSGCSRLGDGESSGSEEQQRNGGKQVANYKVIETHALLDCGGTVQIFQSAPESFAIKFITTAYNDSTKAGCMFYRLCSQNPRQSEETYLSGGKIVDNQLIKLDSSPSRLAILALSGESSKAIGTRHCGVSSLNSAKRWEKRTVQLKSW